MKAEGGITGAFADRLNESVDAEFELNVGALVRLTHAALPTMLGRRRGWGGVRGYGNWDGRNRV